MATYNGEKYIKEQLDSILLQLGDNDEVIISDDSSTDNTLQIIENFQDSRIHLYKNQKFSSPIFNFENALKHTSGNIIILSDQDDIWYPNKIDVIKKSAFKNKVWLKMYNGNCIDNKGIIIENSLFNYKDVNPGLISNIKKNSFMGCNIAFSKELLHVILPFPKDIPMHDMWIGSCTYLFGDVEFVDKCVFSYRIHENNFTGKKTSFIQKISWRYRLVKNLMVRYFYVKYSN
ncbi:MAG: glycosyltransferase family 2 protein [Sulfurimonas sp.]|jgi:glycosyltransferase involved in cell wall biosynthesis